MLFSSVSVSGGSTSCCLEFQFFGLILTPIAKCFLFVQSNSKLNWVFTLFIKLKYLDSDGIYHVLRIELNLKKNKISYGMWNESVLFTKKIAS